MGQKIAILGGAATGKTTSIFPVNLEHLKIKGLKPEETLYINPSGSPLSMRGYKKFYTKFKGDTGNLLSTTDCSQIVKAIHVVSKKRPEIKHIVIEDASILSTGKLVSKSDEQGYGKFVEIAKDLWNILSIDMDTLREDLHIIYLYHDKIVESKTESSINAKFGFRIAGKMVQDQLGGAEVMFDVILCAKVKKTPKGISYYFLTKPDGVSPARTPIEMFPRTTTIPNDMGIVMEEINDFYGYSSTTNN